jgi:anti-anti-sigma factor
MRSRSPGLVLRSKVPEEATVVRFVGDDVLLDETTVDGIHQQLLAVADEVCSFRVVVEFDNVRYVSSRILGVLIRLHKSLAAAGRHLTIRNLSPLVWDVFALTKLNHFLDVRPRGEDGEPPPEDCPSDSPRGVLVVDDDIVFVSVLEAALRQEGLRVWSATSGWRAIQLYRIHHETIGVILLDALMVGMDGPDTLAVLHKISPGIRCCFIAGDVDSRTETYLLRLGAVRVFRKPFALAEVLKTLDQLACRSSRCGGVRWIEIPVLGG